MGRITKAIWWSGLILLFASGVLFGLAVAEAEADMLVEPWRLWFRLESNVGLPVEWRWISDAAPGRNTFFTERSACERAAQQAAANSVRSLRQQADPGDTITLLAPSTVLMNYPNGARATSTYSCWPASADPRQATASRESGDGSGAAQAAEALAQQVWAEAQDACEAQWGRNALMVAHCRKSAAR
jgi:hypothetical protein